MKKKSATSLYIGNKMDGDLLRSSGSPLNSLIDAERFERRIGA